MSTNTEKVTTTAGTGTAAEWISANPVLLSGEWGKETDTGKMKNGDGVTAWNSLDYSVLSDLETILDSKITGTTDQICKAWVNFDGTTMAIRESFNVSSITWISTGQYYINFLSPLSTADFCVSGTVVYDNTSNTNYTSNTLGRYLGEDTINRVRVIAKYSAGSGGGTRDMTVINVAIFA